MFKALGLVLRGKDARKVYQEELGKDRPVWLSRRFVGTVITLIGGVLGWKFGVSTDQIMDFALKSDSFLDAANRAYDVIKADWPVIVSFYGSVIGIIGVIRRKKTDV